MKLPNIFHCITIECFNDCFIHFSNFQRFVVSIYINGSVWFLSGTVLSWIYGGVVDILGYCQVL